MLLYLNEDVETIKKFNVREPFEFISEIEIHNDLMSFTCDRFVRIPFIGKTLDFSKLNYNLNPLYICRIITDSFIKDKIVIINCSELYNLLERYEFPVIRGIVNKEEAKREEVTDNCIIIDNNIFSDSGINALKNTWDALMGKLIERNNIHEGNLPSFINYQFKKLLTDVNYINMLMVTNRSPEFYE